MNTDRPAGGTFIVSLDFELYWGVRDKRRLDDYGDHIEGARRIVPRLLELFRKYEIHATWATVGFVFFDSLAELVEHLPDRKPSYVDTRLSPYGYLRELGEDETSSLFHFAPDLVRQIAETPHQELGTHTFSHYYCLEQGQSAEEFRDDLNAALRIADEKLQRKLVSLVFPRNQADERSLKVCKDVGILAYRGNERAWFYVPCSARGDTTLRRAFRLLDSYLDLSGTNAYALTSRSTFPVNLPSSRFLRPYSRRLRALEPLRFKRIADAIASAARNDQAFHLWWHPENFGVDQAENLAFLERILATVAQLRTTHGMRTLNMGELARMRVGASHG